MRSNPLNFLDKIFQPIVEKLPTFITDTNHALLTLAQVKLQPDKEYLLFLLDVSSLYTSIQHADGLKAIRYFFEIPENKHKSNSTDILARITELVLTLNSFELNGLFFRPNQRSSYNM
ncbi:nicotinamide riboside kinase 1 isoform X1, partial [Biomphalaria glabrata]